MTKKSASRLERDAKQKAFEQEKNNNRAWDELNELHSRISVQFIEITSQISQMFSIQNLHIFLENKQKVTEYLKTLNSDIGALNQELSDLYKIHKDKNGGWKEMDDFLMALELFESYRILQSKFEGIIMPLVISLTQEFDKAMVVVNDTIKKKEAENLTDPNVVSDAVIKNT